ncbi:MAG: hypothetical protein ACYCWW_07660 [Deltaproteobacteria bacterium]
MNGFVKRLAARLLAQEGGSPPPGEPAPTAGRAGPNLTRNRHFELFADGHGQSALRIYRRLRALSQDILKPAAGPVVVASDAGRTGRVRLEIRFRDPAGSRTAYLSEDELELLLQNAAVRRRVAG